MPISKDLDAIVESDLQALVDDKVPEGKTIEYKESLDNSESAKKKFLENVSSFANAIGGDLIYGIRVKEGVASKVCGLAGINPDVVILGLESLMQNCIKPRVPGVSIRAIPLVNSNIVIIIRVRKSWAAPHVVDYQKHWKFFSRNSRGKYPMDIQELRAAFLLSETTIERIGNFRSERVREILENKTPIKIDDGPKIVIHVIPLNAFTTGVKYDVSLVYPHRQGLISVWSDDVSFRYNFDGFLVHPILESGKTSAYAQFYRNGIIEAVDTSFTYTSGEERFILYSYERKIIETLINLLKYEQVLGAEPPFITMLSLLRVSGYTMQLPRGIMIRTHKIDKGWLLLPEAIIETFDANAVSIMRDIFDIVWNATGVSHSLNYNREGIWVGKES